MPRLQGERDHHAGHALSPVACPRRSGSAGVSFSEASASDGEWEGRPLFVGRRLTGGSRDRVTPGGATWWADGGLR
jgi:hypothetical protein